MAAQAIKKQNLDTQSIISWCGSASGNVSILVHSRRLSSKPSVKPAQSRPVEVLTVRDLGRLSRASIGLGPTDDILSQCVVDINRATRDRRHFNGCFHYFRFVVSIFGGLSCGIMLLHRYNMATAILQMVNQTHLYLEKNPQETLADYTAEGFVTGGEFDWNNEIVAIILGWYMFSYTLPQTFMAKWNIAIGCRLAIPIELAICSISNLLTPTAAYMGWEWVVACRLMNGFGAAGVVPGMISLYEDWMRYDELSLGLTISSLVTALMMASCPLIAGYLTAIHWSYSFLVPGYATLGFCALWLLLITDKPETNWFVSRRELDHLDAMDQNDVEQVEQARKAADSISQTMIDLNECDDYKPKSLFQIFKLPTFYAYLFFWVVTCICNISFVFILPAYLQEFLKVPISENGFYCCIINLGALFAVLWPHQLMRVLNKMNFTTTQARIISQGVCNLMQAATFVFVGAFHQYQLPMFFLGRCFFSTDVIFMGSVMSNFSKAGLSSLVFAMINTLGNLTITGAAPMIGMWLDYTGSSSYGWQMIFFGFGLAQLVIFLSYALFIDSEPIKFSDKPMDETQQTNDAQALKIHNPLHQTKQSDDL